ncbi:hypothetical protein CRG98_008946 [Punica granatum]|uniref:GH10 domain-containing protein n=1 Tax=Punica granatum TaxID=22663 RepID=A0A2I0KQY9_PUNGR|nr:hypothetical protein CRG98_008946 [Punica granatum]
MKRGNKIVGPARVQLGNAVFENELKWYYTEPQRGIFNYRDANDMLDLCIAHNIEVRSHCTFWEVESMVQSWVRARSNADLLAAVHNRLSGPFSRSKGMFWHYDANNEILHGSFYQDRLGKVGGIGIQSHIESPVGRIVCSALDKLGILGLPICYTGLDTSSVKKHVRAVDLEVMLCEAYAHAAVDVVMLWRFWEQLFMSRENTYLINAEGKLTRPGRGSSFLRSGCLVPMGTSMNRESSSLEAVMAPTTYIHIVLDRQIITKSIIVDKGNVTASHLHRSVTCSFKFIHVSVLIDQCLRSWGIEIPAKSPQPY